LSIEEIRKRFPNLLEKVEKYRPKILCFNGKALFQAFASFQNTRIRSSIKEKIVSEGWGEQPNFSIQWNDHTGFTKVFCVISTSGRVAQYKKQRKVKHFEKLKELIYNDEGILKKIQLNFL
jgi:mismatch-specific thymine-DNA glycosylase